MNEEVTGASSEAVTFDREELARLGRIALQGRQISEVIEQTRLSRSTISKLLNKSMKSRPSVNTLRKLAGPDKPVLLRRMLEACGYPLDELEACGYPPDHLEDVDALCRFIEETPVHSDAAPVGAVWSESRALAMVLESLETKGYGERFEIDYRADGVFAVNLGDQYPRLICVPVSQKDPEPVSWNIMRQAMEGNAKGIARWGMEDTATLVLTDSPSVFQLLKRLPNPFQVMAVAVVSGDGPGFGQQYTILPTHPSADPSVEFPVVLTMSGE